MAGGGSYANKPRPVVILQSDRFDGTDSVTVCPLTSDPTPSDYFRIDIAPNPKNGLQQASRLMADKVTTVPRSRMGRLIGRLEDAELGRLAVAIVLFLELVG